MNTRPEFEEISTGQEFDAWYWMKEELAAICRVLKIPATGRKQELRNRIIARLDGVPIKPKNVSIKRSNFNWAREELQLDTIITDSITFGKNLRDFLSNYIPQITFSTEFMHWVKTNTGKTLGDAITAYSLLAASADSIDKSSYNVMNAYVAAFLQDNPDKNRKTALMCWDMKKYLPAKGGLVKYSKQDLLLLR